MKQRMFFSFTPLLLIPLLLAQADNNHIYQRNASSNVYIQTDTTGNTNTSVTTDVNGNTQIFNTSQPGTYTIQNNGSSYTVASGTSIITGTPSAIPSRVAKTIGKKMKHSFWSLVKNFFTKLFHFL